MLNDVRTDSYFQVEMVFYEDTRRGLDSGLHPWDLVGQARREGQRTLPEAVD